VKDGFLPEAFRFDSNTNTFVCPEGKVLRPRVPTERPGRTMIRYQAKITDCKVCPQRTQCCSGSTRYGRSVVVTKENPVVTAFRARTASVEGEAALKQRSAVAEFVNDWLKEKLGLRRFRVRGLAKIRTEAMWAALTYNVQQVDQTPWASSAARPFLSHNVCARRATAGTEIQALSGPHRTFTLLLCSGRLKEKSPQLGRLPVISCLKADFFTASLALGATLGAGF
jgi:hypothetical protein